MDSTKSARFESKDPAANHMGHLFLQCMKKRPDALSQIDAATDEKETNASVLSRSVRLARCLRSCGLKPGDVLSLGGRNHLDLHIPFYAALLNGLPISGVDPKLTCEEIKKNFQLSRPKVAFCEKESHEVYKKVIDELGMDTLVITFGGGDNSMEHFIETHDTNESIEDFRPAEFDLDKVYVFLLSTSGTSGKFKLAAVKHGDMIYKINMFAKVTAVNTDVTQMTLNLAPVNWISGFYNAIGLPMTGRVKLQTSKPDDFDHVIDMINKYKPVSALFSPALITALYNHRADVDLTCFRVISLTGTRIYEDVLTQFRALLHKDAVVMNLYGMTETLGQVLAPNLKGPAGSCGLRFPAYDIKLVDPESGKEITEPNTPGECLVRGAMFTEYYNDPEETAATRTADGFFKTGDLLYFDENDNFFYVDRLKGLIKFRNYHILPSKLEEVIHTHPAVSEVCVCGLPDHQNRQLPVACVVKREGCGVTAEEIQHLVASKLPKEKQLSGGVVFLDELPKTSTGKIMRTKLLDIVMSKLSKQ